MLQMLTVKTTRRCQLLDVTDQVSGIVKKHGAQDAAALIYVPHTTAGVLINENADPSVAADIQQYLTELVPQSPGFRHSEGNSDAHIKASIIGTSVLIPIQSGTLALGTWQGIYFAEFDGPRQRKLYVQIIEGAS